MYNVFRNSCERLLRIPPEPEPPPGDEASARVFRAAPRYLTYRKVMWAIRTSVILLFAFGALLAMNIGIHAGARNETVTAIVGTVSLLILPAILLLSVFALAIA